MKNIRIIRLLIAVILLIGLLPFQALADENTDLSVTSGCHSLDAAVPLLGTGQLIANAQSVILYETNTDTLMYAWEGDARIFPASLVKILTCLISVEQGDLSDVVTVKQSTLDTVDSDAVSVDLVADEVLSVEDLLYCMMVSSANDAAAVLAEHISGSQDVFVARMNEFAKEIGCESTNFTNVHGLHNDDQYTTVRDMARILATAVKNEEFMRFFSAVEYSVPETNKSEERNLVTGNFLMSTDETEIYFDARVTGGRTGTTALGDRCVASTATDNGLNYISIIFGAKSVYNENGTAVRSFGGFPETTQLLDAGFSGFYPAQILYPNQALRQCAVENGESDVVLTSHTGISTVLPSSVTLSGLQFKYRDETFTAPIQKDDLLSYVEIWNGSICVGFTDLYALNAVSISGGSENLPWNTDKNGNGLGVWGVIGIVFGAMFVAIFALWLYRNWKIAVRRNKSRNRRSARRRNF